MTQNDSYLKINLICYYLPVKLYLNLLPQWSCDWKKTYERNRKLQRLFRMTTAAEEEAPLCQFSSHHGIITEPYDGEGGSTEWG